MKKVILLLAAVVCTAGAFAQKSNVSKAKNKALSSESPDFKGAREAIKLALENEDTKNDPNTWYVAGLIGYKENESLYLKAQMGQNYDQDVKGKAVVESYNYFLKADELGQIPNKKGKIDKKVRKNIKPKMMEYYRDQQNLVAYGADLFEQKKYEETVEVFDMFLSIPDLEMFDDDDKLKLPKDTNYSMIKYFKAIAASNADMSDLAIETFIDLKDECYETKVVYQLLYEEYFKLKDTVNYVATLEDGFKVFPTEPWFLQNLINHFIFSDKLDEAIVYLENAIAQEPNVAQYHYVKANLDEERGQAEKAIAGFEKTLELDPTMDEAHAGIGRVYFNKAVKMQEDAAKISNDAEYNKALIDTQEMFKKSLPHFQKAAEVDPEQMEHKKTLRTLYYRLGMDKEYEAISAEMQ